MTANENSDISAPSTTDTPLTDMQPLSDIQPNSPLFVHEYSASKKAPPALPIIAICVEAVSLALGFIVPVVGFVMYAIGAFIGAISYAILAGDYRNGEKAPLQIKAILIIAVALCVLFVAKLAIFVFALMSVGTLIGELVLNAVM